MIPLRQDKPDEAFEVLALHDWDALEALRTVLAERDAIEERLRIAVLAMGRGGREHQRPVMDFISAK